MAKPKKSVESNTSDENLNDSQESHDDGMDGFKRVNPLDGDRLYFKPTEGAKVRGVLLGRHKRTDTEEGEEERFYYQLRVTMECPFVVDGEGTIAIAHKGAVVHVDEKAGLTDLASLARGKVPHEVVVQAIEKIKLSKGPNTFWRWNVFAREAPKSLLSELKALVNDATPF